MNDETELPRRRRLMEINLVPGDREALEDRTWSGLGYEPACG